MLAPGGDLTVSQFQDGSQGARGARAWSIPAEMLKLPSPISSFFCNPEGVGLGPACRVQGPWLLPLQ